MNEVNANPVQNQGDLLAALAYIPFFFVVPLMKKGAEEFYMNHAKNGAVTTIIFFIPVITAAFIFYGFGSFLYGVYFIFIGFLAYKAYKHEKNEIPVISGLAKKIPLEKFLKKAAETVSGTGLEGKISTPTVEVKPAHTSETSVLN